MYDKYKCEFCGANLDPQERCTCNKEAPHMQLKKPLTPSNGKSGKKHLRS